MHICRNALIVLILLVFTASLAGAQQSLDLQPGLDMFDSKKYQKAQQYFNKLSEDYPKDAAVAYYLGRSYFHSRKLEDAVKSLEKAVKLDGKNAEYHYLLGLACASYINEVGMFKKMGVAKKMKNSWITATELDASHKDAQIALISFYLNAPEMVGGSAEEAAKSLKVLKQNYPDKVFPVEGVVAEKKEQYDQADKLFRQAIESEKTPMSVFNLASYLLRRKQNDEAISLFNEYLAMDRSWKDPNKAFTHFRLGDAYAGCKKYSEANKEYLIAQNENNDKNLGKMIKKVLRRLKSKK